MIQSLMDFQAIKGHLNNWYISDTLVKTNLKKTLIFLIFGYCLFSINFNICIIFESILFEQEYY